MPNGGWLWQINPAVCDKLRELGLLYVHHGRAVETAADRPTTRRAWLRSVQWPLQCCLRSIAPESVPRCRGPGPLETAVASGPPTLVLMLVAACCCPTARRPRGDHSGPCRRAHSQSQPRVFRDAQHLETLLGSSHSGRCGVAGIIARNEGEPTCRPAWVLLLTSIVRIHRRRHRIDRPTRGGPATWSPVKDNSWR